MTEKFVDAFYGDTSPTFPTTSVPEHDSYPEMKIDHAFIGNQLKVISAKKIKYLGSDHYPIEIIVN